MPVVTLVHFADANVRFASDGKRGRFVTSPGGRWAPEVEISLQPDGALEAALEAAAWWCLCDDPPKRPPFGWRLAQASERVSDWEWRALA